jgi:hypothetical protein
MTYEIVYIAFVSANFGGVEQKIIGQFDALTAMRASAHLYLVSSVRPGERFAREIEKRSNVHVLINSPNNTINPWTRRREKFDLISNSLSRYNPNATIVYFRYPLADILFLRFLEQNRAYRFVTEHQEIENKLRIGHFNGNLAQDALDFIWGKAVRSRITGFVGVSSQYLENQLSYLDGSRRREKYSLVNGNGIDTTHYHPRSFLGFDGHSLKLLFIGSGYKYQGLHRLLISLDRYYRTNYSVELVIHVVGVSVNTTYLSAYLTNPLVRKSVIFHGFVSREDVDRLAEECHLAVNSLSYHLVGIEVSSTLKAREYFARGIPFVTSSSDSDIEDGCPYTLKVSDNEDDFDVRNLIDFAERMNKDPEHPQAMRQFAVKHLDWSVKMKNLVTFFDHIMRDVNQGTLSTLKKTGV